MKKFHVHFISVVFRYPIIFLFVTLVFFFLSLAVLPNLKIDNSVDAFFNKKSPAYINFQPWKEQFGTDELIIVALETDDVFTFDNFNLIDDLTKAFENIWWVDDVTSLTTVNNIIGQEQDFIVEKLVEKIPETKKELAALKYIATVDPLYVNNVVSPDGRVAAIVIELSAQDGEDDVYKKKVIDEIQGILASRVPDHIDYYISGLTAIEYFYAAFMQEDFKAFMPFLFLMIIMVMYISFRSVKLTVLPLFSIMISVAASMALLHLLGFSVNNVTTIIPPILMAIMIADSVHVIGEALERREKSGGDGSDFLKETMRHLMFPCFLTTATTAVGFWSLSMSEIAPVRQLGIVVGCGVFIALVLTFTFLPGLALVWRAFDRAGNAKFRRGRDHFAGLLTKIADINQRHYKMILLVGVMILLCSVWGLLKIKTETSVVEQFRRSTPIYRSTLFIEDHLSGVHTLNLSLKSDSIDFFKKPASLKMMDQIELFLHTLPEVDKVTSVNDYLKEINKSFHQEDERFYRIPDTKRMVSQFVLLYGREDLEDFIDDQWQWATIRVRLKEHSTVKLAGVIDQINTYLGRYDSEFDSIDVLGQTVLEVESNNTVAQGQLKSLGLAMLMIFGMMFLVFRSVSVGLVSIIPNILPILMNFGLMGLLGIRLDSATSMIAVVGIGIVVDDTIHFLHGYGEALLQTNDHVRAMTQTIHAKGRPIILTSLILFFGFGILSLSKFMPTANFGMLTALVMINALVADLVILPSVLIWAKPRFNKC